MGGLRLSALALVSLLALAAGGAGGGLAAPSGLARIDHVVDGDTVDLTNGARVRLVQIDTPEVYFGVECYGPQASAETKRPNKSAIALALAGFVGVFTFWRKRSSGDDADSFDT